MSRKPPVPPGPIVCLIYRAKRGKRRGLLSFLRRAFPVYERPGGIRMALYESVDEPGLFFELVAYASKSAYDADQRRVESDPGMRALLRRFRSHASGAVQVIRGKPLSMR